MKKIIFYHPQAIAEFPGKGSELRPKKMKEAFQQIGYDVVLVVGDSARRAEAIQEVREAIRRGETFEFLYAESSNMPIPLADPHHLPLRPMLDLKFFKMLNSKSIPIGFFYRDLYWRVDELKKNLPWHKYLPKQLFHWLEWYGIVNTVDHLFVPTEKMAKYFPTGWPADRFSALYPGCDLNVQSADPNRASSEDILTLFYVGGVKPPYYDLRPLIKVVSGMDGVELIVCCREQDWESDASYYRDLNFDNIRVVHADSTQIAGYYEQADIFFDVRTPVGYLKNTITIKLFESLGHEVPLLLLDGTESAAFVKRQDAGWVADSLDEAAALLQRLKNDRTLLQEKIDKLKTLKHNHSWEARAREAGEILVRLGRENRNKEAPV